MVTGVQRRQVDRRLAIDKLQSGSEHGARTVDYIEELNRSLGDGNTRQRGDVDLGFHRVTNLRRRRRIRDYSHRGSDPINLVDGRPHRRRKAVLLSKRSRDRLRRIRQRRR